VEDLGYLLWGAVVLSDCLGYLVWLDIPQGCVLMVNSMTTSPTLCQAYLQEAWEGVGGARIVPDPLRVIDILKILKSS
jgi:hypothetical protein